MSDSVVIPVETLRAFVEASKTLCALRAGGVADWEWHDECEMPTDEEIDSTVAKFLAVQEATVIDDEQMRTITSLITEGLRADNPDHKQFCLESILRLLAPDEFQQYAKGAKQ